METLLPGIFVPDSLSRQRARQWLGTSVPGTLIFGRPSLIGSPAIADVSRSAPAHNAVAIVIHAILAKHSGQQQVHKGCPTKSVSDAVKDVFMVFFAGAPATLCPALLARARKSVYGGR